MRTTAQQNSGFIESIIRSTLLEEAIDWIASNMEPEDIFGTTRLDSWAEKNGFVRDEE